MCGFSKRYNLCKLVYYEVIESIESAIAREKQIKKWLRRKKEGLITGVNKEWGKGSKRGREVEGEAILTSSAKADSSG